MPWLPIQLLPQAVRTAFMPLANVAVDIAVPTGAAIVVFSGPGDFYVSLGGRAQVPAAGMDIEAAGIYKPQGFFYVGGAKQISVVSPGVNGIVQCSFWSK